MVADRLEQRMLTEARIVADIADHRGLPLRTAAYVHALERLSEAMDATGTSAMFADTDAGPPSGQRSTGDGDSRR